MLLTIRDLLIGSCVIDTRTNTLAKVTAQELFLIERGIICEDVFAPIPLTGDVLEALNFHYIEGSLFVCEYAGMIYDTARELLEMRSYRMHQDGCPSYQIYCRCKYLHEMQGLARMVGVHDFINKKKEVLRLQKAVENFANNL